MNDSELKLQAYFDGELSPEEAREVANLLARDKDAVAMLQTLKATRSALSGFEAGIRVPETREFYWSKIQRAIGQSEVVRPQPESLGLLSLLRRLLVPAAGVAALVIAGIFVTRSDWSGGSIEFETASADSRAFTYRDYSAGTTLVWLSYPAEQEPGDDSWMSVLD